MHRRSWDLKGRALGSLARQEQLHLRLQQMRGQELYPPAPTLDVSWGMEPWVPNVGLQPVQLAPMQLPWPNPGACGVMPLPQPVNPDPMMPLGCSWTLGPCARPSLLAPKGLAPPKGIVGH